MASWIASLFSGSSPKPASPTSTDNNNINTPATSTRILEEPPKPTQLSPSNAALPSTSRPSPQSPIISQLQQDQQQQRQQQQQQQPPINRNRNKVIFAAGVTFFAFSMLITRRSFARRRLRAFEAQSPVTHPPSSSSPHTAAPGPQAQPRQVSGALEAVEALNIATINVVSVAMMATGAALWYLDINSMDEARRVLRGGIGVDGTGRSERDAEEEFEEWMATTLARKEYKDALKVMASEREGREVR